MGYDVEGYLRSKGVNLKLAGANQGHFACPFCGEDPNKRGRLYVNIDPDQEPPGLFTCFLCGTRGAINKLRKQYGDKPLDSESAPVETNSQVHQEILQEAANYYHELLSENIETIRYLRDERGLSIETMQKHEIGWADGTLASHFRKIGVSLKDVEGTGLVDASGRDFLRECITIPYHVAGNVVQIRGKQIGAKYLTPPGQKARLYNADSTWTADQIVITEGELDALVVEQLGFATVGVPGATSWQDSWNGYFSEAKKVFIVFDNDTAGEAGAERVARAIGPKSRIVKMPEMGPDGKKNDPSEWIVGKGHSKDDFQMLLIKAKGGHLLSVDDGYAEWSEVQSGEGIKFGIDMLDTKIAPGLLPSQIAIMLAKSGTGKTIATLNFFQRMCIVNPDIRLLFISLEQTRGDWFERARRIYRFYNLKDRDLDTLDFFRPRLMMVDKNRISEEEMIACIDQYDFEVGQRPDLVAVDYLGYWARSFKGEAYERTGAAVMALKAIAKEYRIAVFAPHQVSRNTRYGEEMDADAGRDAGTIEETADFLFTLWSEDNRSKIQEKEKTGVMKMKIAKSRHGGTGSLMQFQWAPLSLALIPFGDPLAQQAKDEFVMAQAGDDFDTAIYRHATGDMRVRIPEADLLAWRESVA